MLIHLAFLAGCGGTDSAESGRAIFTVIWPQSRLIPAASNSIKVEIRRNAVSVDTKVIPRPAGGGSASAEFQNLPLGQVSAIATAYPNADGTGVAQAIGSVGFTVQAGQTTPFTLTMDSTIDRIEVNPPDLSLNPGQNQQLGVTARNSSNQIVLISTGKLDWLSLNTNVATVDSTGRVTAQTPGSAQISVTETESGKTSLTNILVRVAGAISFQPPVDYSAGGGYLETVDVDGDGRLDIAVSDGAGFVRVLYGRGDGTFDAVVSYPFGGALECEITVSDFDGDTRPDFAVCDEAGNRVAVLRNLGGRSFAAPVYYPVGQKPYGVTAGDFNGDSKPDLAVSNDASNNICVLLNSGSGTFGAATFYPAGSFPSHGIEAVDLNGDTRLDIAVANYVSANVIIYWGNGTGGFVQGPTYGVRSQTSHLVVADLNRDGKPDLATSNTFDNSVSVLINNGGGSFSVSSPYAANQYPHVGSAADLDGDGLPDIAIPNNGTNYFTVLRNTGGGVLAAPVQVISNGNDVRSLTTGHFNGDSKPDIAVSNWSSGTISIFINATP